MANQEEIKKIDIWSSMVGFFKAIKKFGIAMVIGILVVMCAYFLYTWSNYTPVYQSQVTFSVNTSGSSLVGSGTSGNSQIQESLPYILKSQYMKNLVTEDLNLSYFPASVSLESKELADFYVLTVTAGDPQVAYDVVNSMMDNAPRASVYVLGQISFEILDSTGLSVTPVNYLSKTTNLVVGAFLGVVLCMVFAFVYALTSHTIGAEEDLKKYLSVTCLASLPNVTFKKRRKRIDKHINIHNNKIGNAYLEMVRTLRARVQRKMEQMNAKVVMVTSSIPSEGKSTIAVNLALSLAEKGCKVILVDLDLRNPSIGAVMGKEEKKQAGVVELLSGKNRGEVNIREIPEWNLSVLYAGEPQNNAMELLHKPALGDMIQILRERYDYVVLDTPPAAMLSDAAAVAMHADCAVYVVKQDYARIERITEGMESLSVAQLPILGVVLNGAQKVIGGYGHYRYGDYGHYGHAAREADGDKAAPEYVNVANPWEND